MMERTEDDRWQDRGRNCLVAKACAGGEGVGQMQRRVVVRSDAGGDAALRQHARSFKAQRRLAQEDDRLRRQRKRRHQAGDSAGDRAVGSDVPARIRWRLARRDSRPRTADAG